MRRQHEFCLMLKYPRYKFIIIIYFQLNNRDGLPERMVATTTVKMELDGSMSAQSQIETIPSAVGVAPSAPTRTGSLLIYFILGILITYILS